MSENLTIRLANRQDADALIEFNCCMALETEDKVLASNKITPGIHQLLSDARLGFYLVAQINQHIAGALMVTTEWSDWRNGHLWWIQSVYVLAQFRRKGVYASLHRALRQRAQIAGNVCGIRLYVEKDNLAAQATYRKMGMKQTPYLVYEEIPIGC